MERRRRLAWYLTVTVLIVAVRLRVGAALRIFLRPGHLGRRLLEDDGDAGPAVSVEALVCRWALLLEHVRAPGLHRAIDLRVEADCSVPAGLLSATLLLHHDLHIISLVHFVDWTLDHLIVAIEGCGRILLASRSFRVI